MKLRSMTACYLTRGEEVLLLYRVGSRGGKDSWRGIGGHFEENELNNPEACVLRELQEEIGVKKEQLEELKLRYVTIRRAGEELRQNYYFFANLCSDAEIPAHCDEGELKWVKTDELMRLEMPHSAYFMLQHWLDAGRYTDKVYGGTAVREGVVFTELEDF